MNLKIIFKIYKILNVLENQKVMSTRHMMKNKNPARKIILCKIKREMIPFLSSPSQIKSILSLTKQQPNIKWTANLNLL